MAELTADAARLSGARLASQQVAAIAWLRWRILANGFRRKGGAAELIGRILLFPILAAAAMLPTVGGGLLAYYLTLSGHLARVSWILWGAFALTQLLNINLGQPGTTFDPTELIRFPLPLRRYVLVRLGFGLLSPANIIVSLMSLGIAVGVSMARPDLLLPTFGAMLIFAITNVLFTRMVFAWVDRWLSTRRAREVFTAFIFIFSLGVQFVNVRFNPGLQHNRHHRHEQAPNIQPFQVFARRIHPYIKWLPPELAANAITSANTRRPSLYMANLSGCACFAVLFLSVYTLRMRTEFRGENLSDIANATRATKAPFSRVTPRLTPALPTATAPVLTSGTRPATRLFPSTLAPLLGKELLILRRNVGLFYGLIAPAVMVFLFAGRMSVRGGTHWVLLAAVGYALLGISPMSYNSFGTEGTGAQLYFFAPLSLREVFVAKNIFTLLLALAEVIVVVAITSYVAGRPSLLDCVSALLWALGTLFLNTTLGNVRSISAPKKVNPGKTMKKAQSPVSAYIAMGILLACAGFGFACELLGTYLQRTWIAPVLMLAFAAVGAIVYEKGLQGIEAYALQHRDTLFEELGKKV